jgi:hypothetical protein
MRSFYRRLGVTVAPGQEWKLLLPLMTLVCTFLVVVLAGLAIGVSAALYLPMALLIAPLLAGIPIAYMSGAEAGDDRDEPEPR